MKSIPENEGLNHLILSHILTEEIYIIPERTVIQTITAKKEATEKIPAHEKPAEASFVNASEKTDKKAPLTKEIIVVLDKPANAEELEFLTKILGALKMTIQDVSILSQAEFSSGMNFKKLISFNVSTDKLNHEIKTDKYIIKEHEKVTFLSSDSLQELIKDVKKKKQLWEALQLMFTLK